MIELYGHPFAAFVWKPLIALYARGIPFAFRMLDPDHPENAARMRELSPTGQFPALVDGDRRITESNAVVEYIDRLPSPAAPMIPADADLALEARMLADVFDDYVAVPMQRIVAEAFRGDADKDPYGVREAEAMLDRSYAWLEGRIGDRPWAAGTAFTLADCAAAPALFYADWVRPIPAAHPRLRAYRARVLAHPPVKRTVDEARPYRKFFPLGAPDRD